MTTYIGKHNGLGLPFRNSVKWKPYNYWNLQYKALYKNIINISYTILFRVILTYLRWSSRDNNFFCQINQYFLTLCVLPIHYLQFFKYKRRCKDVIPRGIIFSFVQLSIFLCWLLKPIQRIIDLVPEFYSSMYTFTQLRRTKLPCQYCFFKREDKWKIELKRQCFWQDCLDLMHESIELESGALRFPAKLILFKKSSPDVLKSKDLIKIRK